MMQRGKRLPQTGAALAQETKVAAATNSVPRPSEVLSIMSQHGKKWGGAKISPVTWHDPASNQQTIPAAVYFIQIITGARAQEILSLRSSHIIGEDTLIITGAKRSRNREVRIPELAPQLAAAKKISNAILFPISYSQYYRWLKARGFYTQYTNQKTKTVSHKSRHEKIMSIAAMTDATTAQDIIGHKSAGSTERYLRKKGANNG
jgi:integrase